MARAAPSLAALSAGLVSFVLPILYAPFLIAGLWSARYVLVAVLGVVGVALLVSAAWIDRRPPVLLAAAFVGWGALSTALSDNRTMAFWGYWGFGTGLLFIGGLAGAFVVGRLAAGAEGRTLVERGLLAGGVINSLLAIAQVSFDLSRANIGLEGGRAPGLFGNPVYLAVLLAGCFWLVARRSVEGPWRLYLPLAALFAAGIQLSGGRLPLGLSIIAVVLVAVRRPKAGAALLVAAAIGFGAAGALASATGTTSASSRVTADTAISGGGLQARGEMWRASRHAVADRPVFGAGPSRFQAATSRYRTDAFARFEGPGALYADAHNLIVEYAVTTGVVGVAILLLWLLAAARDGREAPAFVFFAAGAILSHLFEPQSVGATPLAFLALGAAGPPLGPLPRPARLATAVAGAAGAAVAVVLVIGFYALDVARLDFTPAAGRRADQLLPWQEASEQQARIALLRAIEQRDPKQLEVALRFREQAVAIDPANPVFLVALANTQLEVGRRDDAIRTFERVLAYNPTSTAALNALGDFAIQGGRVDEGLARLRRSLRLAPEQADVAERIRQVTSDGP